MQARSLQITTQDRNTWLGRTGEEQRDFLSWIWGQNQQSQSMTPSEIARQLSEILIVSITWMHWQLLHYLCAFQAVLFHPLQEQCHTPHRRCAMWRHHTSPSASQRQSRCSFVGYTGQDFPSFHPPLVYSLRTEPASRVWKVHVFLSNTLLDFISSSMSCSQSPFEAKIPEKTTSFMSTFQSQGTSLHSCPHLRTGNSSSISVMFNMLTCRVYTLLP